MANKQTLLEIVQDILSEISSDEVNSIGDTEDSELVAKFVRSTYKALITRNDWPHTRRALVLIPRSDSDFPTHMTIDDDLQEVISVQYNKSKKGETRLRYTDIKYCDPDDFIRKTNLRDSDAAEVVEVVDDSGVKVLIRNDKHPDYYTSFNDKDIVFDSFDNSVDSTLQASKCQAQGYVIPEFRLIDSFVPDLPADAFPLLYEETLARAQFKLRQMVDQKAEQEAGRQNRRISQHAFVVGGGIKYPNYGR